MKIKKVYLSIIALLLICAFTMVASACSCNEKYKEIRVFVNGTIITEQTHSVNVPTDAGFSINDNIKVVGILSNDTEEVLDIAKNEYEVSISPELPTPLVAGVYNIVVTYKETKVNVTLNVRNADDTITVSNTLDKTYDGLPVADPTGITKSGLEFNQLDIAWYTSADKQNALNNKPINADDYVCVIKTPTNNSYTGTTKEIAFTIAKADKAPESAHHSFNGTYAADQKLSNFVLDDKYIWANPNLVPTCDVTSYAALYNEDAASGNYNDYPVNITITLEKATINASNYELNVGVIEGDKLSAITLPTGYAWSGDYANFDPNTYTFNESTISNTLEDTPIVFRASYVLDDPVNYQLDEDVDVLITVKKKLDKPTLQKEGNVDKKAIYTGSPVNAPISFSGTSYVDITGNQATNVGSHTANYSIKDTSKCVWADRTTEDVTINWEIANAPLILIAKTTGNYAPNALTAGYDGNYFATFDALFDLTTVLPFEIRDTNSNTLEYNSEDFTFAVVQNTEHNLISKGLILYADADLTTTTTNVGTAYVCVTYSMQSNNYSLQGENGTCDVIFEVTIVAQTLSIESAPELDTTNYGTTVGTLSLNSTNAKVFINLAQTEDSTTLTKTYIAGSWSFTDSESKQVLSGDDVNIRFTASEPSSNYETTVNSTLTLSITIVDNITVTLKNITKTTEELIPKVDGKNDEFYYSTNNFVDDYAIVFNVPNGCVYTYDIYCAELNINNTQYMYSKNTAIQLNKYRAIYTDTTYTVTLHVTAGPIAPLTKIVTIELIQNVCTININGQPWDGNSRVSSGDEITVLYDDCDLFDSVKVGNSDADTYTVLITDNELSIPVNFFKNNVLVFYYYLNVNFTPAFASVTINGNDFDITENRQTITYNLIEGEGTLTNPLNIYFNDAFNDSTDYQISYTLSDSVQTTLTAGTYEITDLVISENSISLTIFTDYDMRTLLTLVVDLKQFTRITKILYSTASSATPIESTDYTEVVTLRNLLTDIEVETESGYTAKIYKYGTDIEVINFGINNSPTVQYTVKVYSTSDPTTVLEARTISVVFDIDLQITPFDYTFTTNINTKNGLTAVVKSNENCALNFSDLFENRNNYTIEIYTSDAYTAKQDNLVITVGNSTDAIYYIRIKYNNADNVYLDLPLQVYLTTITDLADIFTSTDIYINTNENINIFLPEFFTMHLTLSTTSIPEIVVPASVRISNLESALTNSILPDYLIDDVNYTVSASYFAQLLQIEVHHIPSDTFFHLFVKVIISGYVNNYTTFNTQIKDATNNVKSGICTVDNNNHTVTIVDLANKDTIKFISANNYAVLQLYRGATLLKSGVGEIEFTYAGDATYRLTVVPTEGSPVDYTVTTSGTFEDLVNIKLYYQDIVFETFRVYNNETNNTTYSNNFTFETNYSENSTYGIESFSATVDANIVPYSGSAEDVYSKVGSVDVEITTSDDWAPVCDELGNILTGKQTFTIIEANGDIPAHITFYFKYINPEDDTQFIIFPCYLYFVE